MSGSVTSEALLNQADKLSSAPETPANHGRAGKRVCFLTSVLMIILKNGRGHFANHSDWSVLHYGTISLMSQNNVCAQEAVIESESLRAGRRTVPHCPL